ncbi:hypothetical protein ACOI1H_14870 [Loktanella sp. DJP18]|uniref:hypothetical protein n=1 Tax=Loktanella sp. DJP18 TaxID=3409788 RepID=UPI003BB5F4CF
MYEIKISSNDSIEIDFWGPRLKAARTMRVDAWFEVFSGWRTAGGVLNFDPSAVQALFCDLRIDARRVARMLDAQGDVSAAPIDPKPELADDGESQVLRDELYNEELVFSALTERLGLKGVDFGDPSDVDAFIAMREVLANEGAFQPGLRGI